MDVAKRDVAKTILDQVNSDSETFNTDSNDAIDSTGELVLKQVQTAIDTGYNLVSGDTVPPENDLYSDDEPNGLIWAGDYRPEEQRYFEQEGRQEGSSMNWSSPKTDELDILSRHRNTFF